MKRILSLLVLIAGLPCFAQTSSFTYQGRLNDGTVPATGSYDFQFLLRDAPSGSQVGSALTNASVVVTNGLFTVTLDFGAGAFTGANRWLEIGVRTNGTIGAFTILLPRQQITSAPYALQAANAGTVTGAITDSQLSGNIPRLSGGAAFTGTVTAGSFTGSGTSLTGLDASQLTSGAVPAAALGNAWQIGGNNSTAPGTHFVGTTDNQALEFKVNGSRALRLEPNATSPNVIGGYNGNYIAAGVAGATIMGGGSNGNTNSILANYSAIGGGYLNTIQTSADYSKIGGGVANAIQSGAFASTIGGGVQNSIQTGADRSLIGGGAGNTIQINANESTIGGGYGNIIQTNAYDSTIAGGDFNTIQTNAFYSTIGGGVQNTIQSDAHESTIGGGQQNTIQTNAFYSTISGGSLNMIQTNAIYSTIGGGRFNTIQTNAYAAIIGGGFQNTIKNSSENSTIGGGYVNAIQTNANYSTIAGGYGNAIQSYGQFAAIPGGRFNLATNFAFAAGHNAKATNTGAFVWSDGTGTATLSTGDNSVTMRASGGFSFLTGTGSVGASMAAGGTSWATISDRNAKKNFQLVDVLEVLEKLEHVPVQRWNYKWEPDDAVPHIGPVAQDFKGAFYSGRDDKSISTLEFDGIELAAIQGLNQKVEAQKEELAAKQHQIESMEKRLSQLERLVTSLAERK